MVKRETVSISWQIVFMFIPYVSIWAYYRIEKLGYGILLGLGLTGLSYAIIIIASGLASTTSDTTLSVVFIIAMFVAYAVNIWIHIHFMLKWSRAWNSKIESTNA